MPLPAVSSQPAVARSDLLCELKKPHDSVISANQSSSAASSLIRTKTFHALLPHYSRVVFFFFYYSLSFIRVCAPAESRFVCRCRQSLCLLCAAVRSAGPAPLTPTLTGAAGLQPLRGERQGHSHMISHVLLILSLCI